MDVLSRSHSDAGMPWCPRVLEYLPADGAPMVCADAEGARLRDSARGRVTDPARVVADVFPPPA